MVNGATGALVVHRRIPGILNPGIEPILVDSSTELVALPPARVSLASGGTLGPVLRGGEPAPVLTGEPLRWRHDLITESRRATVSDWRHRSEHPSFQLPLDVASRTPAIPLGTTDLSCGRCARDLTCCRNTADKMTTLASHRSDPNHATENRGHCHAKALNTALGGRLEVPH
jgi:hypothetical protein